MQAVESSGEPIMMAQATFLVAFSIFAFGQARPVPQPQVGFWQYFPFLTVPMNPFGSYHTPRMNLDPEHTMFADGSHTDNNPVQIDVVPNSVSENPTAKNRRTSTIESDDTNSKSLEHKLATGIFEMARNIQASMLSSANKNNAGDFTILSPINVATALSLLQLGAKGQTDEELQHVLEFDKLTSTNHPIHHHHVLGQMLGSIIGSDAEFNDKAQIRTANGIFMQTGFSPIADYRTTVETIYQSQVTPLDFKRSPADAVKSINEWVRRETNGRINNILTDGIDRDTQMMVVTAVYFRALWQIPFIEKATSKRAFYPNGRQGPKIMVDTMGTIDEFRYYDSEDYACSIVELPYKDSEMAMYVITPHDSDADKLRALQEVLTFDIVEDMISKMRTRWSIVTLPKMQLNQTINLKDALNHLGVKSIFETSTSDFSGISDRLNLSVDQFVHSVQLTVNESGTEGGAATATDILREGAAVEFRAETPFMFFVRHAPTKLPIFYGSVLQPVSAE